MSWGGVEFYVSGTKVTKLPEEGTNGPTLTISQTRTLPVNSNPNPLLCNTLWIINKEDGRAASI